MPQPPAPPRQPGYGVVEYEEGHARFVAFGLTEAQTKALCTEARRLGIRPTSTAGWLTRSISQSEPKT